MTYDKLIAINDLIRKVGLNRDKWTVSKMKEFEVDRENFMIDSFIVNFPNHDITQVAKKFDYITRLASRNRKVKNWLIDANSSYQDESRTPGIFRADIDAITFKRIDPALKDVDKILERDSDKKKLASDRYKETIKEIEAETEAALKKAKVSPLVKILKLQSTEMPLSLNMAVVNSVTDKLLEEKDQKRYSIELLIAYKKELLRLYNDDPLIDIEAVIEAYSTK